MPAPATFSVLLLTAAPPGHGAEAAGAFVKIEGRESLLRAVELFLNRDNVKQVQLVFDADMIEEGKRNGFVTLPDRMQRVQARTRWLTPPITERTVLRLRCHFRFVTLWAWLTR